MAEEWGSEQRKPGLPGSRKPGGQRKETGKPGHIGHRQRLRERFMNAGPDALADYELLEMALFRTFRQMDTKPVAKELLDRFGTISDVLAADETELEKIGGIGAGAITDLKLISALAKRVGREKVIGRKVLSSWQSLIDYCKTAMAHEPREQFRILFLDKKNVLIADEVQQTGTVDHTPVYPREVIRRALELSSTAIILVHNHPSGDPTPSDADVKMTAKIVEAAGHLGIIVHDHVIVGRDGHASFRALGLIA